MRDGAGQVSGAQVKNVIPTQPQTISGWWNLQKKRYPNTTFPQILKTPLIK